MGNFSLLLCTTQCMANSIRQGGIDHECYESSQGVREKRKIGLTQSLINLRPFFQRLYQFFYLALFINLIAKKKKILGRKK
jgi:hypothetical protein